MKFLSPINVNTEYTLPFVDGTNGQVLTTDGNGAVYWGSVSAGSTNLNALTDVELTNPTSGQILRYAIPPGGTLPVWYNWTPTFLTAESDTLSTVTSRGASTSYAVTFNGNVSVGTSASLSFGNATRQMINLWSTGYGIGVQSSTTYFRSDSGFAWFRGGVHNNTANNPGAEGVLAMRIDSSSNLVVTGSTTASSFVKTGGTASQFLKADGSVDTNTYLTAEADTLATVTARGATTTGNITVNGAAFATSFSATGLLITNADTSGSLQPDQGSPANKIYSFRWAGNEQGYIDTNAKITFAGFKTPTGTSAQFLKADGSVDSSTYITSSALSGYATQTWVNSNFYNQGQIDDFFYGNEPILGYNKTNWDAAYADKINSASFSTTTGVLTLTQQDAGTITVDLDGRYLETFTETDPTVPAHVKTITATQVSDWDKAYGWGDHSQYGYATIASPTFTGTPAAPTAAAGTNTTQIATTAFVQTAVSNLVDAAPATLDTLNELAAALGDDPNFATTVTNSIATKVPQTRTLTINGTAFDLSANRSWTIDSADGYVSDVRLVESTLSFSGEGNAFSGTVDLSTLPFQPVGSYLTAEADTFDTVTARGATSNRAIRIVGGSDTFQFAMKLAKASYLDTGGHTTLIGFGCENAAWSRSAIGHTRTTSYDAGYLGFYVSNNSANGTELLQSDLRMMINRDGNVGIGTTSPISKLQVNGQFRQLYSRAFISNPLDTDGYAGHIIVNSNNANGDLAGIGLYTNSSYNAAAGLFALQESSTAASMVFYAGSNLATERMRITSSGRVGIGTTSPTMYGGRGMEVSGAGQTGIRISDTSGGGKVEIGADSTGGYIQTAVAGNALSFLVGDANPLVMRLSSAGNVGIGTTAPGAKLHVNRDGTLNEQTIVVGISSISQRPTIQFSEGSTVEAGTGMSIEYDGRLSGTSNKMYINGVDNVPKMTIMSGGNVGIGTTSPSGNLQISGVANYNTGVLIDGDTVNGVGLGLRNANGHDWYLISTGTSNGGGANNLGFYNSNVGEYRVYFKSDGNVGIGTISPIAKLHISSSGTPLAAAIQGDSKLVVSGVDGNMDLLSLDDNSTVANSIGFGRFNASTGALIHKFGITTWANTGSTGSNTGDRIAFNYGTLADAWSNSELMTIKASGNVGIGTTSPATKLDVSGVITATGGNSTNWNSAYSWGNHADAEYIKANSTEPLTIQAEEVIFTGSVTVEGTFTESSSIRFKENIEPLPQSLEAVNALNPVSYNKFGADDREIGLIAEEVAELFPEVVTYNEEGQPQGIQYQRLSVILLKAVQELTERVNKLENK